MEGNVPSSFELGRMYFHYARKHGRSLTRYGQLSDLFRQAWSLETASPGQVRFTASGPHSGTITLSDRTIRYDGLEPIIMTGSQTDVVVTGSSGHFEHTTFESSRLFPALRDFVDNGGGVVTTGWFVYDMNNMNASGDSTAGDANYISPAAFGQYTWSSAGTTITILDSAHPIAGGMSSYTVNTNHHEQTTAIDASATSLATGPTVFGSNTSAIAYDEVGGGLGGAARTPDGADGAGIDPRAGHRPREAHRG